MDDRYYDNLQRVNPGFGKPRFSRIELRDIFIAVLAMSIAFTLLYRDNENFLYYFRVTLGEGMEYIGLFGLSAAIVVMSFLCHELAHKFTAQKYGFWSEFRMWPVGLVMTLVTPLLGLLFAAPGAVMIRGNMTRATEGKISLAGPAINIVLCLISICGCYLMNYSAWVLLFLMMCHLNAFLAVFNLLPLPPLDGSKILPWNKVIWGVTLAIAVVELIAVLYWIPNDLYIMIRPLFG